MTSGDENIYQEIIDTSISDEAEQEKVQLEIEEFIKEINTETKETSPEAFSKHPLRKFIRKNLNRFSQSLENGKLQHFRTSVGEDLFDLDTWKGIYYMLNYTLEYQSDLLKMRLTGNYETDEWGYDPEVLQFVKPLFDFLYKSFWRVETSGMENIPDEGKALLVCNHSGYLPWDGVMIAIAIYNEHPNQRLVRSLYDSSFPAIPYISTFLIKLGQVLINEENCVRLLEQDELVAVFPERYCRAGMLLRDKNLSSNFGYEGFVHMSMMTGAPIIPVSIVGADEADVIPLPTKWFIDFGEAIQVEVGHMKSVDNPEMVSMVSEQIQKIIKGMNNSRLSLRQSIFFG